MDYSNYELLKGNEFPKKSETNKLREKFISNYCNKLGWDKNNLTIEQLEQIKKHKEFHNPELLLS
jgi:hypothetical protein